MAEARSLLLALTLASVLAAAIGTAQAKGEDELGVSYPSGYTPGETVRATITTVGSSRNLPSNTEFVRDVLGFPEDARYVVSFRPLNSSAKSPATAYAWVPAAISFIRHKTSVEARLVFQVPSVRSGGYVVRGCWVPCTKRSSVGRTELYVGATKREANLLFRLARAESRAGHLRSQHRLLRARLDEWRETLASTKSLLAEKASAVEDLETRVWVLERRKEDLEEQRREAIAAHNSSPALLAGALVVGAFAGLAAASSVRSNLLRRATGR